MADSTTEYEGKNGHYNDWPNTQGFDATYEENAPVELKVEGYIPNYAVGTLFRTGLGAREIETEISTQFRVRHWFDSLSVIHRFQIHLTPNDEDRVRVTYNSRSTCDGLIAKVKSTGCRDGVTFGAKCDPCKALFQKMSSTFTPHTSPLSPPNKLVQAPTLKPAPRQPDEVSIAVTINVNFPGLNSNGEKFLAGYEKGKLHTLSNRTDASTIQHLEPKTLEPIGIASQSTLHPLLKGQSSAAHSSTHRNGDLYNYNLEFVKGQGIYRIFHVSASTGKTSILATVIDDPSYIHSLLLTENYVVFCVWNALYAEGGAKILLTKNIVDALAPCDPERPCKWYIIDNKPEEDGGRGLIATYESDPFFCFHTVNAYEELGEEGNLNIIADLIAYDDLDILKRLYIDNLLSDSPTAPTFSTLQNCKPRMRRFTLSDISMDPGFDGQGDKSREVIEATMEYISSKELTPELPTINPYMSSKKHRYVYGVLHTGRSTFFDSIAKYDTTNQSVKSWWKHGHTPGEPIFIADPAYVGDDEDAGVLLSVVLDGIGGKSYLLVLDARNLEELGKAHVDGVVGFGFHGTHVPY